MGELECVRNVEYSEDSYLGFYLRRDTFFFFFCHCINLNLDRDSRVIAFRWNRFLTPRRHSYSRHNAGNTTLKYILKMIFFALCLHFNSM